MKKIRFFILRVSRRMDFIGRRQIAASAAATAFWFFLSLVPIVMLAAAVLPYTPLTEEQILRSVGTVVPDAFNELLSVILADIYGHSVGVLSLSILVTLWSSARGFASLIRGLELVYEQEKPSAYLPRRLRGVVYTLVMLLAILATILLGGFGRQLLGLVERLLPMTHGLIRFVLHFRILVVLLALTAFFTVIYRWSTEERLPLGQTVPGALLAAAGWSAFSQLFSVWIKFTGVSTYGSLATVVMVMLWLYYCVYILLLGACFNRAIPDIDRYRRRKDGGQKQQ